MARQLDYHKIHEIFTRFHAADPEPEGELDAVSRKNETKCDR